MKILFLQLGKLFLRIVYFFMKLQPTKKQIVMLSRESDTPSLDFELLSRAMSEKMPDYNVVMYCELLSSRGSSPARVLKNTLKSMKLLASSCCCILDTYSLPVSVLHHKKGLVIVQIWHALGGLKLSGYAALDKEGGHSRKFSEVLCMHKNYTFVTAASEDMRNLYHLAFGCDESLILKLGMPRVDYILGDSAEKKEQEKAVLKAHPELQNGKKNILYAPTFRPGETINLKEMLDIIDFSRYNLAVKAHVLETEKAGGNNVIALDEPIFDLFGAADFIVTDYSAAAAEASLTAKPLFFYVYDIAQYREKRGLFIDPLKEYPSLSAEHFSALYAVMENGGYDESARLAFRRRMVETADTGNTERILNQIRERM